MTGFFHNAGAAGRVSAVRKPSLRAFTLVELILVMGLLAAVVSMAAPSLSGFFRGRNLDSEARRFLALTHSAQSRAVSEGIPMSLWVDVRGGEYGLEADPGFETDDAKAVVFALGENLRLETVASTPPAPSEGGRRGLPELRFHPDGSLDNAGLAAVRLTGTDGESSFVALSRNRLNYEIRARLDDEN